MRRRVQCNHERRFGKVKNVCHKILCEIVAEDVKEEGADYVVTGLREVRVKCPDDRCKKITTIKVKED